MEPKALLGILLWMLIFCIIKLGFIGMSILIQHRFSDLIERAGVLYDEKPRKLMVVLGVINGLGIPFVAILLISTEVLALPGLVVLLAYLGFALLSYTVIYRSIGAKIFDTHDTHAEVKRTLYGGLVAEAAFFTPVLGQLYSIGLFFRGLGAIILAMLNRH